MHLFVSLSYIINTNQHFVMEAQSDSFEYLIILFGALACQRKAKT